MDVPVSDLDGVLVIDVVRMFRELHGITEGAAKNKICEIRKEMKGHENVTLSEKGHKNVALSENSFSRWRKPGTRGTGRVVCTFQVLLCILLGQKGDVAAKLRTEVSQIVCRALSGDPDLRDQVEALKKMTASEIAHRG